MYLILYPRNTLNQRGTSDGVFEALYTDDMHRVGEVLQKETEARVFRISQLPEILEIKSSYEEITKETQNV